MISSWFSPLPQMWFVHKGFFVILRFLNVKGKTIATQVSTMNVLLLTFPPLTFTDYLFGSHPR